MIRRAVRNLGITAVPENLVLDFSFPYNDTLVAE